MTYTAINPALAEPTLVTTTVFAPAHATGTISIRRKQNGTTPAGTPTVVNVAFAAAPVGRTRLHFMGDSLLAENATLYGAGGSVPSQAQNLLTTDRYTVVNNGIATQNAAQMRARFNSDVLTYYNATTFARHIVVIAAGDNDETQGRPLADCIADINAMITMAVAGGFRAIVVCMHSLQYSGTVSPFAIGMANYYKDATNKANLGYDEIVPLLDDPIARYDDLNVPALRPYWTGANGVEDRQHYGPPLAARIAVLDCAAVEKVNLLAPLPAPPVTSAEYITNNEFDSPYAASPTNGFGGSGNATISGGALVFPTPQGDTVYTQVGGLTVGDPYVFRIVVKTIPANSAIGLNLSDIGGGTPGISAVGSYSYPFTATAAGGNIFIQANVPGGASPIAIERVSLLHA